MELEKEIENGESKKIEFKQIMPNNKNLMKTAIAFSNCAGGKLIIGVTDDREVIGISDDDVFTLPDRISNIIYDSCYPTIIPEIYTETIEEKTVLVVEFYPGNLKPYYLKSKGKLESTFVRIGATNKIADEKMILELERQKRNISFDEEIDYECEINEQELKTFSEAFSQLVDKKIEKKDLLNFKIIKEENNKIYYSRGGKLISGNEELGSNLIIKAARFKGNESTEFIDSKSFEGSLHKQVEGAMKFIKIHIAKYSQINELQRKDKYVIPLVAIREALVNAVVHRDYSIDGSSINIKIFDNRIEIISPGSLPKSLDINDIKYGRSEVRNKIIARFFKEIKYIEQWGTGIQRIIKLCSEEEIKEPQFWETGAGFRVVIFKKNINDIKSDGMNKKDDKSDGMSKKDDKSDGMSKKDDKSDGINKNNRQQFILDYIMKNNYITTKNAMEILNLKDTATKKVLKEMVTSGLIEREGKGKATRYKAK